MNDSQNSATVGAALLLLVETLLTIALLVPWLFGFIVAKGFWSTFSCLFPFYSFYLVIEHFAIKFNLL